MFVKKLSIIYENVMIALLEPSVLKGRAKAQRKAITSTQALPVQWVFNL